MKLSVGAHYYPWYGQPCHAILGGGEWSSGYTNKPRLGTYDVRDPRVIVQHVDWAGQAGLDFLMFNWTGRETWDDISVRDYFLRHPCARDIRFCFNYDSYQALNKLNITQSYDLKENYRQGLAKGEKLAADFGYLADTYFQHPNYLRVNGRPVVMIYIVREFTHAAPYLERLRESVLKRGLNVFLIADVVHWESRQLVKRVNWKRVFGNPRRAMNTALTIGRRLWNSSGVEGAAPWSYFDAITAYNLYATPMLGTFLPDADRLFRKFAGQAGSSGLGFVPSVIPGYDDRALSGQYRPPLDRAGGEFYRAFWRMAARHLDPALPMMLVTSFNEWHEGTEIEPSDEYGDMYLRLTKELISITEREFGAR